MLSADVVVAWVVLPAAAAIGGWFASGSSHRRRFARWQAAYQKQLQAILRREAAKGSAEITTLKGEIVRLKAERLALQSRQRVVELKTRSASAPRLTQTVQAMEPAVAAESSDDGFAETQPFEQRA